MGMESMYSTFLKIENARDYISETTKFTMFS